MAVGVAAALVTWAVVVVILITIGMPWSLWSAVGSGIAATWRRSLWWGLGILTIVVQTMSVFVALRSGSAAIGIAALALVSVLVAAIVRWHRRAQGQVLPVVSHSRRWSPLSVLLGVSGSVIALTFAIAALGPVTNYDSGLYHLGAIAYAGDFPTIPGLANLYFPLGYGTSTFPLAAVLGNGPWSGQGYRLLNGLILVMALLDLCLRFRRPRVSAGSWVLLVGLTVTAVPLLWMPDYWVTSPTSDTGVLVLTVVSAGYLVDAVFGRRLWAPDAAVAAVISIVLTSMRPLMVIYAIAVIILVAALVIRRHLGHGWRFAAPIAVVGLAVIAVQCLRDVRLSGWIQYPLSFIPVNVAWRAADPVVNRTATLGAARDPNDLWNAASGWSWITAWVERLPSQWEFWIMALLLLAVIAITVTVSSAGQHMPWRRIGLTIIPAALTILVWFLASPPSFRFAWGPLFVLGTVPLGIGLATLARQYRSRWSQVPTLVASLAAGSLAMLALISMVVRVMPQPHEGRIMLVLGSLTAEVPAAVPPTPTTHLLTLDGGLTVRVPADSDQCWASYPLCTPVVAMDVVQRGPDLGDGFAIDHAAASAG